jgi:hypothetical protein
LAADEPSTTDEPSIDEPSRASRASARSKLAGLRPRVV